MDRMIYTAMTGMKSTMNQQTSVANNMANLATAGFKAELNKLRAVPIQSEALPSRAFVVDASVGNDFTPGPIQHTGGTYDVAVQGKGWFVLKGADGSDGLTRDGSFKVDENGILRSRSGLAVQGDSGEITIPADSNIEIAADGSITAIPNTGSRNSANVVARLKLVNPDEALLQRRDDGLFRLSNDQPAQVDENVQVAGGYVEGSNVNVVEQLVSMISLARNFELDTKLLEHAQENDRAATRIISAS